MHRADKIRTLAGVCSESIPAYRKKKLFGLIPFHVCVGYLMITEEAEHWSVMLCSHKTSHSILNGPAYAADFRKNNGERKIGPFDLRGAWRSSIGMYPVRTEEEAVEVFNWIGALVDQAYSDHSNQTVG